MKSFRMVANPCPVCGKRLDGATNTEDETGPTQGAITVCVYCASILEFAVEEGMLRLRVMSLEDRERILAESPQLRVVVGAIVAMIRARRLA